MVVVAVAQEQPVVEIKQAVKGEVADQIRAKWGRDSRVALAVAQAESGLRSNAQGWNCYYPDARGRLVSQACHKGDEQNAWSTDCGVFQINTPGTVCPQELFNVEINMERAWGKYTSRGWQPWSAYNNGAYKGYL